MVSGPITIKKVYLKNFISHKETEVVFEKGVTAFVGPNGAGKSSILDAIYFALTGRARRGKLEGLVNAAAPRGAEAVVKLWLDVDGREVVIERRISKSGRHEAVLKGRGRTILRVSTVNKEIEELLGLKADSLQTVAIIPQGALTRLITLTPAERLEILDELLGLNAFEEAWEKLKEYKVSVKTKKVPSQTYQPTKQG
ncbi:MAG: SMC family ATPase [Desulfurococcales archaeon]|nr:SMC family ATPase [Desulfurococcales archaeon]